MIQTINISLIPSDNKPVINVSQYDNGLRVLRFNVFDDIDMEVPHEFDGETVTCNIRKNDNNIVVITGTIETETTEEGETSFVQVVLTEQACACVGSNYGEISLSSGDDVIGTCNFKLIVERSPLAGGVDSQSEIDNLTTQIEEIASQVIGDDYYTKTEVDDLIDGVESEIPTKISQLTNDSGFITDSDIPTIPTKTSQLTNDSGFITDSDIPTIPTKTSQLTNDSGFTTIDDAATVSDKTWSSEKISDELYALLPVGTATGSIASFNTALVKPIVSYTVDINATTITHCAKNMFKLSSLTATGITISDNEAVGSANSFSVAFNIAAGGVPDYKFNNTIYTLSLQAYCEGNSTTSGQGLAFGFRYSDNTSTTVSIPNNLSEYDRFYVTSTKPITFIYFAYVSGYANNWHIKNIQLENGSSMTDYSEYSGIDYNLPLSNMPTTYLGDNNFFTDYGDTTVQYKDTIQNYIDTRVQTIQAASSRSLSLARNSNDTLLGAVSDMYDRERGETDEK